MFGLGIEMFMVYLPSSGNFQIARSVLVMSRVRGIYYYSTTFQLRSLTHNAETQLLCFPITVCTENHGPG